MKASVVQGIRDEVRKLEAELARLQKTATRIQEVTEDIAVYKKLLSKHEGKRQRRAGAAKDAHLQALMHELEMGPRRGFRGQSYTAIAYDSLKQAGKPLTGAEIIGAVAARGKPAKKHAILGTLYRAAKTGTMFKLVRPGVFGLTEWEQK